MTANVKSLRACARVASALGLLSVELSGELSPLWVAAAWLAWASGWILDRYPDIQASGRRLETLAVLVMVGMLFVDFFLLHASIFMTVTHFLLLFQIVKLVGEKRRRDCLQIFLFAFFQILASCTLSVDAWHAAVLLALIPTATAVLFWNQLAKDDEVARETPAGVSHKQFRRMAAAMCVGALPLNLVLTVAVFVIFPRLTLNAPLPGFGVNRSGYTNQVNLAQKGALTQNAAVVLWLSFSKPEERLAWDGYVRGDVLTVFNGREWSVARERPARLLSPDSNGVFFVRPQEPASPMIRPSITLADTSANTLFLIGTPLRVVAPLPALQEFDGESLHWPSSWERPLRYDLISGPFTDVDLRPDHLALPAVPLERVRDLTEKVAGSGVPLDQAQKIEEYLRSHYRYSTNFGDHIADNPVDYFLFERRDGACGHFASAMAVMLRLRKIPSRIVAGYYRGEWNEPAQSFVIRERDAHAWVEAYMPNKGWVSFDPTPREAPAASSHGTFFHRLGEYWGYFGLQWNRFVIQYDLYSQLKAFERLKGTSGRLGTSMMNGWSFTQAQLHRWRRHDAIPAEEKAALSRRYALKKLALFLSLACFGAGILIRKRSASQDASIRFYSRFLERMARTGHAKNPGETGWEYAARLATAFPDQGEDVRRITDQYYRVRFQRIPAG